MREPQDDPSWHTMLLDELRTQWTLAKKPETCTERPHFHLVLPGEEIRTSVRVVLEVNQQGQFLFVEEYTGLPLLEGFCGFLLHGADDFVARPKAKHLRYLDVAAEAATLAEEATPSHVPQPTPAVSE